MKAQVGSNPPDSPKPCCSFRKACCFSPLMCFCYPEAQVVWTVVSQAACTKAVGMVGVSDSGWVNRLKRKGLEERVVCVKKKKKSRPSTFDRLLLYSPVTAIQSQMPKWRHENSLHFRVKQTWIWIQALDLRYVTSVFLTWWNLWLAAIVKLKWDNMIQQIVGF